MICCDVIYSKYTINSYHKNIYSSASLRIAGIITRNNILIDFLRKYDYNVTYLIRKFSALKLSNWLSTRLHKW